MRRTGALALFVSVAALACSGGGKEAELSEAAERGRRVYMNVCIACHHGDPNEDGTLGPAIAGSSRELLHARVIEGNYPEGYTPKRPGEVMPRFEHLEDDIGDLAAYLAEIEEP